MNFYSQAGQDRFVWELLPKRFGLFIDIGCGGDQWSNTLALEQQGWRGLLFDIGEGSAIGRLSEYHQTDATVVNWKKLLGPVDYFDYLSLDIDSASLAALKNMPLAQMHFGVITIEHDSYRFGNAARDEMRRILSGAGYDLICEDVMIEDPFEDWWVSPALSKAADKFRCKRKKWHEIV